MFLKQLYDYLFPTEGVPIGAKSATDGTMKPLLVDSQGRLKTDASGGGGGGTSSTFGDAFPADGTAIGWKANGGATMVAVELTAAGKVPVDATFSGGVVDQGVAGADPWPVEFAAPQAVTGPLTDAELRATPVPISATDLTAAAAVLGTTTDATVQGNNTGTINARLRGISVVLNSVWDSLNNWFKVSIQNATLAVTQSGSWVLSAGSAIIGKVGIDQTTPGTTNAVHATNFPTTVDTNSGNKSASTPRVVVATDDINLAAINAVSGTTAGAAVITDANGTIQQYLRGLIKLAITAGSFLVRTSVQTLYGSATTLTTTNWVNLASGSGWQSDAISTSGAKDVILQFKTKGAAGSTLYADFYIAAAFASGDFTDNATGTEGTFTAANRKNSRSLGQLALNTTNSVVGELHLKDIFDTMPERIAIIGINNSGGTISNTGADTVFKYQLVN
jgi:hypothetical protein